MSRWCLPARECTIFYRHTVVPIIEPIAVGVEKHQRPHFSGNSDQILVVSSTVDLTLSIIHRDLGHATKAAIGCACCKNTAPALNPVYLCTWQSSHGRTGWPSPQTIPSSTLAIARSKSRFGMYTTSTRMGACQAEVCSSTDGRF